MNDRIGKIVMLSMEDGRTEKVRIESLDEDQVYFRCRFVEGAPDLIKVKAACLVPSIVEGFDFEARPIPKTTVVDTVKEKSEKPTLATAEKRVERPKVEKKPKGERKPRVNKFTVDPNIAVVTMTNGTPMEEIPAEIDYRSTDKKIYVDVKGAGMRVKYIKNERIFWVDERTGKCSATQVKLLKANGQKLYEIV